MLWKMKWRPSFTDKQMPILIIYETSSHYNNRNWSLNLSMACLRKSLSKKELKFHCHRQERVDNFNLDMNTDFVRLYRVCSELCSH